MIRPLTLLLLVPCLCLAACRTTEALKPFELDLVSMIHNSENGYTLLVYEDGLGDVRHVLRREGICEAIITYTPRGAIKLKERGRQERRIDSYTASQLTKQINDLLKTGAGSISW